MAHQITETDVFAFTGERRKIWHGLGNVLEEGKTAQEAFVEKKVAWPTELVPVFADVPDATDPDASYRINLPEHRAHVRMDNRFVLGIVGKDYKPFENMDVARFADMLAGADAASTVSTLGTLYGGRRIFVTIKLPHVIRVGADIVESYVVVSNGHGGFAAFHCYPTSMRPVCDNTLRWSERDLAKGMRFRHSGDIEEKIQQARVALGLALQETEHFEEQVKALAGVNLSVGQTRDFMTMTYDRTFGALPDKDKQPEAFAKLSAKRAEVIEQWMANMEDKRQQVQGIEGTAWAALNAVTQYHDHERGRYKPISESGPRLHSNLFGVSSRDKQKALKSALTLV